VKGGDGLIVLDLEWNRGHDKTPLDEILQIGAVRLDRPGGRIVDTFNVFIRPQVHKRLNRTAKALPEIDASRASTLDFSTAYHSFLSWCGEERDFAAWGADDFDTLNQNARYWKLPTLEPRAIFDLQTAFSLTLGTLQNIALWWAVDEDGRCWCVQEFEEKGLIVQEAAQQLLAHTLPTETIDVTYAPPDMWSRQKDTGRTMAELFLLNGVPLMQSSNNRVQGHMMMKDMLAPLPLKDPFVKALYPPGKAPEKLPGLMVFDTLRELIADLRDIQADEKNPNDCAKQPHDVTHTVDACRYFCISRVLAAEEAAGQREYERGEDTEAGYDSYMTGGEIRADYLLG